VPRPTTKPQLLAQAREEFDALTATINPLTSEQITEPGTVGEWSIKDVVAHLTEWAQMVMRWYAAGKKGETPQTPAEGYTWQQIPALNQRIYEQHRDDPLDEALANFHTTHAAIVDMISGIDNEELFTSKVYQWTKSTTLGAYFVSATCSHYVWARKEIRKGLKAKDKT